MLFLIICAIAGYITAQFYVSKWMRWILKKLKIKSTINEYIWRDIEDKDNGLWVKVVSKECNFDIYGQLVLFEQFERKPIIVLNRYIYRNYSDKKIIKDFDTVPTKRIVIDTSKCDVIELTYDKNSDNIKNHVQERCVRV